MRIGVTRECREDLGGEGAGEGVVRDAERANRLISKKNRTGSPLYQL